MAAIHVYLEFGIPGDKKQQQTALRAPRVVGLKVAGRPSTLFDVCFVGHTAICSHSSSIFPKRPKEANHGTLAMSSCESCPKNSVIGRRRTFQRLTRVLLHCTLRLLTTPPTPSRRLDHAPPHIRKNRRISVPTDFARRLQDQLPILTCHVRVRISAAVCSTTHFQTKAGVSTPSWSPSTKHATEGRNAGTRLR